MKRGEICYILADHCLGDYDTKNGRPAVIISCNDINDSADTDAVEVVYLTTHPRGDERYHVVIQSSGVEATVLCERVGTVNKLRVGNRLGVCTPTELYNIDLAVLRSLGLGWCLTELDEALEAPAEEPADEPAEEVYTSQVADLLEELGQTRGERNAYKWMLDILIKGALK